MTVYQGEDPDALNNIEIGHFTVEGLRNVPGGQPDRAELRAGPERHPAGHGARKATGLENSITIDNAIARFEEDKLDAARGRVQALFGEESARRRREGARAPTTAAACAWRRGRWWKRPNACWRRRGRRTPKTW